MTFIKGKAPWNKGKPMSPEYKENWIKAYKANPHSWTEERKELMRKKMTGRKMAPRTLEHAQKLSESCKGRQTWNKGLKNLARSGENHHNWKGGISIEHEQQRKSIEYKQWRTHVFKRDDYTCQACGMRGVKLEADHELPWAWFPELRFEILNGRTLCKPCHRRTPTYGFNKMYML